MRILITGATSGIGRALALHYAGTGAHLALSGRRADRLARVEFAARAAGAADVVTLVGSVTDAEDVARHWAAVTAAFGGVDVAILNAGIGTARDDGQFECADYAATLDTNVLGVCRWIEVLLPAMRSQAHGVLAAVSSPAGWRGFPRVGAYAASKAALSTLLESLRIELRDSGVRVVTIEPGFVESEITARQDPRSMPFLLPADDAARRIARALDRGTAVVRFPRRLLWPFALLCRGVPRWCFEAIAARARVGPLARTPR